ncbi:hypothetical protein [Anabaena sp. CA = ATCC 33047]|uniref:hypothetical protein n=1 Tax=Anabaena sp. (strain CA / ATCC 33047) TaxID=52271 RepID=UPI0008363B84|nr:hypothetical protein [Anabaena sp. CA = ATCC 33047]
MFFWYKLNSNYYKRYLLGGLSASIAFILGTQAQTVAELTSPVDPLEINQLSIPQTLTIPPITHSEISLTIGSDTVNPKDLLTPPQFNVITREFPAVWKMRVPIDQVNSLYATYEMKAANGRDSSISSDRRSDTVVPIIIEPLPIREISRDTESNTAVVEGGFRLQLNLNHARFADKYTGQLLVKVDRR